MSTTTIEWTDATWNPVRGCELVSPGCTNCYAMKIAHRFSGVGQPYEGLTKLGAHGPMWTGAARAVPDMLALPLSWKKPRRVFVNSMSDLFHDDVPNEFIAAVFGVMAACPQHTFQVLTKRPERMRRWFEWLNPDPAAKLDQIACTADDAIEAFVPRVARALAFAPGRGAQGWPLPNVWLGVSVEDQRRADERIPHLLGVPARVRFLSCEPLLGPVDIRRWMPHRATREAIPQTTPSGKSQSRCVICGIVSAGHEAECRTIAMVSRPLSWVIVGGESGPGARPFDVAWARSIVAQCRDASVPVFVKQLGALVTTDADEWRDGFVVGSYKARLPTVHRKGGDPAEWPADLRVREFPEVRDA
jgi:protein gp37